METQLHGGCLCGAVRYTLTRAPCSLDDPSGLKPDRHLFVIRQQPWLHLADDLTRYERDC